MGEHDRFTTATRRAAAAAAARNTPQPRATFPESPRCCAPLPASSCFISSCFTLHAPDLPGTPAGPLRDPPGTSFLCVSCSTPSPTPENTTTSARCAPSAQNHAFIPLSCPPPSDSPLLLSASNRLHPRLLIIHMHRISSVFICVHLWFLSSSPCLCMWCSRLGCVEKDGRRDACPTIRPDPPQSGYTRMGRRPASS